MKKNQNSYDYIELIDGDEDIEILRPGTSKNNETQTKHNTVQTQDPEVNKKGQESQNSGNKQETGDPEEVEGDHEKNSEQDSEKESEPESDQESEQESEPKLNESLSEEEQTPSSESDNDGDMAQPPASIRLPWFTGKENEQVEKYFRELKRLKAIYKWRDDHLLNMSLLGLKGRADDWASALDDADKDTFAKLEEAKTKFFGDKWVQWQKHANFSNLKQLKKQSVIDFAGVLKQKQAKSEAIPAMMLAVFLDQPKSALGRQVAIIDPKTFEEAVASATRLKTLKKTRVTGKITGAAAEVKEESKESDPVTELVDRFRIVLARLENMP